MPDTKTSVSERSDEQLVRTIAEWMGLKIISWGYFGLTVSGENAIFMPHGKMGARDRERVMLAMGEDAEWGFGRPGLLWVSDATKHDDYGIWSAEVEYGEGKTFGRAFCECVVAWIEAHG